VRVVGGRDNAHSHFLRNGRDRASHVVVVLVVAVINPRSAVVLLILTATVVAVSFGVLAKRQRHLERLATACLEHANHGED